MAEMFLQLEKIDGESLDSTHSGKIEIKSWAWKTTNTVRWDVNQGGQSTKVLIEHIDINKTCDKASPILHQCCVTGRHIKSGKIICRKNDGDSKFEYMILELTDIMLNKFEWSGDGNEQSINETLGLSFAEYKISYKLQGDIGTAQGSSEFKFNVQTQTGQGVQHGA
jgi:type VI secretion system secreted protein Hcp